MRSRRTIGRISLSFFMGLVGLVSVTSAQPRPGYAPTSSHIFPAGAKRGTTVDVTIGSECLPPYARFAIFGKDVRGQKLLGKKVRLLGEPSPRRRPTEVPITYPKEWVSRVHVSESAKLGVVRWRLSSAQGGTEIRPFIIGELPEFLETESNSSLEKANRIQMPVTVNGRIHGERDLDYFRFSVKVGDVVVCEVLANRLMSRLDPVVAIYNDDGRRVNTEIIYVKGDPVVAFRAYSNGDYILGIGNVSHRGDPAHVYRINISTRPFVKFSFPTGGQTGTAQTVEFHEMSGTNRPVIVRRKVTFPKTTSPAFISNHEPKPETWRQATSFAVTNHKNFIERDSNDTRESATTLNTPITVHGRFGNPTDQDWFSTQVKEGQLYSIVCVADSGSRSFPTLSISDSSGKTIAFKRSIDSERRECRMEWRANKDGLIFLRVRDQQYGAQGGINYFYRLTVKPASVDFQLHATNDSLNVLPGKELQIPVSITRIGQFKGPVTLTLEKTPMGMTAKPVTVNGNKSQGTLRVLIGKTFHPGDATLKVIGQAKVADRLQVRMATLKSTHSDSLSNPTQLQLTVRHPPVFRLFCSEAYLYAHRGSVFPYPMEIERLNNFEGEITLQIGDRQNRDLDGIEMFEVTVPPTKNDVFLPIYLPETMHINIQSQSQLYSQAYAVFTDQRGQRQSVLVLSEKRNMLRTLPPVVKLKTITGKIATKLSSTIFCSLKLERTSNFPGPMTVQLLPSEGFSAKPMTIDKGETSLVIPVQVALKKGLTSKTITFRASGRMPNGVRILSETTVEVRVR